MEYCGLRRKLSIIIIVFLIIVICLITQRALRVRSAKDNQVSTLHKIQHSRPLPAEASANSTDTYTFLDDGKVVRAALSFSLQYSDHPGHRTHYININETNLDNFVFATGVSSNHFDESRDMVASIQATYPDRNIYYYDLGLTTEQLNKLKTWCNVIIRRHDFTVYPPHVQRLNSYAFKPIILHELLQEFEAVLWGDASMRVLTSNRKDWEAVFTTVKQTGGIVQFDDSGRDIFQTTHIPMYRYLPGNEEKMKTHRMLGANNVLYYRTENIMTQVIHWLRLCALHEQCITPTGHRIGCGPVGKPGISICHRYDQSALSILVSNMLNYNINKQKVKGGKQVISWERQPTSMYKTRICEK